MMKCLTSTVLVCLLWLVPMSQCNPVFWPMNQRLIEETCKKTPDFYHLCVPLLKSDPQSASADVRGLAKIMINKFEDKATTVLNKINELLDKSPKDPTLHYCANKIFTPIVTNYVPQALAALDLVTKGAAGIAVTYMHNICNDIVSCDAAFKGKSPITDLNLIALKVATLAEGISKQIV